MSIKEKEIKVQFTTSSFWDPVQWLLHNIGYFQQDWDWSEVNKGRYIVFFKTEEDKVKFILKWL